jgi:hypothetical protein
VVWFPAESGDFCLPMASRPAVESNTEHGVQLLRNELHIVGGAGRGCEVVRCTSLLLIVVSWVVTSGFLVGGCQRSEGTWPLGREAGVRHDALFFKQWD